MNGLSGPEPQISEESVRRILATLDPATARNAGMQTTMAILRAALTTKTLFSHEQLASFLARIACHEIGARGGDDEKRIIADRVATYRKLIDLA
jgi:hypothetical protein